MVMWLAKGTLIRWFKTLSSFLSFGFWKERQEEEEEDVHWKQIEDFISEIKM